MAAPHSPRSRAGCGNACPRPRVLDGAVCLISCPHAAVSQEKGQTVAAQSPLLPFCCLPLVHLEIVPGGDSIGGGKFLGCKEQDGARRGGRGEDSRPVPNACALGALPKSAPKPAGGEGAVPGLGLLSPSWAGAALKEFVGMQRVLPHVTHGQSGGTLRPQPSAAPGV